MTSSCVESPDVYLSTHHMGYEDERSNPGSQVWLEPLQTSAMVIDFSVLSSLYIYAMS